MAYSINANIPSEPNDPVDDCPLMRQNFSNIKNFLQQDHVAAGSPGNGFHKEVTFYDKVPQGLPADPTSVLYTESGTASTVADMRFRNANGIFPVSALRACCLFQADASLPSPQAITIINSFNVTSVTRTSGSNYTILMPANVIQGGTRPMIFAVSMDGTQTGNASILSAGFTATTITIQASAPRYVNILVFQI